MNDPYSFTGDRSTTSLIKPPRIYQLSKRHDIEIEEDVADCIWCLVGNNTHYILERAGKLMGKFKQIFGQKAIVEKRYYIESLGWKIGGKIDLFEEAIGRLTDWKVTSVWSVMHGIKPEHVQQLNINAYLMHSNNIFFIRQLRLVAILRDWSKHKVEYGTDYPKCQVVVQDIPLWPYLKTKEFIEKRIRLHQESEKMPDDKLLLCTDAERWKRPDKYAVMKKGGKRALRLLNSEGEAKTWIKNNGRGDRIDFREGSFPRCEEYCACASFCSQWQEYKIKKGTG
jgi:hypothetical protein